MFSVQCSMFNVDCLNLIKAQNPAPCTPPPLRSLLPTSPHARTTTDHSRSAVDVDMHAPKTAEAAGEIDVPAETIGQTHRIETQARLASGKGNLQKTDIALKTLTFE